jgi:hypothetical protein
VCAYTLGSFFLGQLEPKLKQQHMNLVWLYPNVFNTLTLTEETTLLFSDYNCIVDIWLLMEPLVLPLVNALLGTTTIAAKFTILYHFMFARQKSTTIQQVLA